MKDQKTPIHFRNQCNLDHDFFLWIVVSFSDHYKKTWERWCSFHLLPQHFVECFIGMELNLCVSFLGASSFPTFWVFLVWICHAVFMSSCCQIHEGFLTLFIKTCVDLISLWEMRFLLALGYLLENKKLEQQKQSMHSIVIYIICYALHYVFIKGKFSINKW
jgi:hypothetical protein